MKNIILLINVTLYLVLTTSTGSCSKGQANTGSVSEVVFQASTPGDSFIKSVLTINEEIKVDFIRWDLTFKENTDGLKSFLLNINYGEAQANTLGFVSGGHWMRLEGDLIINKTPNKNGIETYILINKKPSTSISLLRLNDNLLHLIDNDSKLLVGNGGWSYTLNRKSPVKNTSLITPSVANPLQVDYDIAEKISFEGRTPCKVISDEYNLGLSSDCIKIKWALTLHFDPKTNLPTTYTLQRTGHRASDIHGLWTIINGLESSSKAIIYQLDPDKPDKSISFLVGDENVIYFLDKKFQLLTGNQNFSCTLNKWK